MSIPEITNGRFDPNALKGSLLDGELILEVPVKANQVSGSIINAATKRGIAIRDIEGTVYK